MPETLFVMVTIVPSFCVLVVTLEPSDFQSTEVETVGLSVPLESSELLLEELLFEG